MSTENAQPKLNALDEGQNSDSVMRTTAKISVVVLRHMRVAPHEACVREIYSVIANREYALKQQAEALAKALEDVVTQCKDIKTEPNKLLLNAANISIKAIHAWEFYRTTKGSTS